ncbi:MAG: DUF4118 domain-containing protein, partial [Eubacteriales bacterium]|nr:DUF4118 domain-containing protein [Eubacteriales bacterium]
LGSLFPLSLRDTLFMFFILIVAGVFCFALQGQDSGYSYVSMLFFLAVVLISRFTNGYFYGTAASILGMFCVNYMFTYPYFAFNFSIAGYPVTFISMLCVSIITSTMTTRIKEQEKLRAAAEQEKLRSNLLRAISHDLRTPLTSILGAASTLLENDGHIENTQRTELLRNIQQEGEWLIRMVENLLSVTRFQGGIASIHKQPEAVEEIVAAAVQKFRKNYDVLPVTVSVPDTLLEIPMDPILIEQVLLNLLENAVKHAKDATRITLCVYREEQAARFEVWDDGAGIPDAQLRTLFKGYLYRAEQEADANRNMGVGLSVCTAIVQAHGGTLEAQNVSDGVVFRFWLPLERKEEEHAI